MSLKINPNQDPIIVPTASSTQEGTITPAMLAQFVTTANADFYLDSVNGVDTNSGTSPSTPVQTWDAMWALLPSAYTQACRIHDVTVGGGTFSPFNVIYASPRMLGPTASPPIFIGQEADQLGHVVSDVTSTSSVYVGTVVTTSHTLRGYSLRNLATGQQARIADNVFSAGKTTFTLANGQFLPLNAAGTDVFVVTKNATNVLFPQYGLPGFIGPAVFAFQNTRIAAVAEAGFSYPMFTCNDGMNLNFFNCEMDGGTSGRTFFVAVNCVLAASEQSFGWSNDSTSTTSDTQAGLWYHNTSADAVCGAFYNGQILGYFMLDECLLYAEGRSSLVFMIIDTTNSSLNIFEKSHLELDQALMVGSSPLQADTVLVQEDSFATMASSADLGGTATVTINNSAGNAVNFENSKGHLYAVAGTGNAGVGIKAYMSNLLLDSTTPPTVTGTGGDTIVGTTVKAYGALPAVDAATLSIIEKS